MTQLIYEYVQEQLLWIERNIKVRMCLIVITCSHWKTWLKTF